MMILNDKAKKMSKMHEIGEAKRIINWLIGIAAVIVLLNIISSFFSSQIEEIPWFINLYEESNLPTWFSSIILFIAAFYAYQCAKVSKVNRLIWKIVALTLIIMSCDEVAMIHEEIGAYMNTHFFKMDNLVSVWSFCLGPFILLALAVIIPILRKTLAQPAKARNRLFLGIFLYLLGALILEFTVNLFEPEKTSLFWNLTWRIEYYMEEPSEMFGTIIIISSFVKYYKFYLEENLNPQYQS